MAESMSIEAVLSAVDQNFTKTMESAVQSLGDVIEKSNQTASAGNTGASGVKTLASSLGLVAVAAKAFDVLKDSIGGAVERFDTLNKFPVVMQALGYSARDTAKSTAILKKGVDGLPTTLQDVTSVAQQLAPLTGSATKASKSAIALNNAFLASGAGAADSSRGLQQYTQMLSTGKVDMMSWRTLMETMPIALRKVANSFGFTGKSAEQDLYKALQSGQITMDQLNDRFIKLNQGQNGFAALAKKNSAGIMTSFTNLKNSVKNNLAEMLTDIDKGFQNAGLGSIAQVLDNMKGSINAAFKTIGPAVTAATAVILNFAKIISSTLGSLFKNDLFRSLVAGALSFVGALKGIEIGIAIFGKLKAALSVGKAFVELVTETKSLVGVFKSLSTLMGVNPWVLLAAAIAAVVAALVYFFTQTKTGRALWSGFVSWLTSAWQNLVSVATTVWNAIGNVINAVVQFIKPIWQGVVQFFTGIWTSIVAVAAPIWQGLVNVVQAVVNLIVTIWQGLATILAPVIAAVVAVVGSVLITIVGIFTTVWNMLVPIVQVVWQLITAVITTAISMIGTVITTGISVIVTVWTTVWNVLVTVVSTVWSVIGTVVTAGLQVIVDIVTAITDVLQGNWSGAWNAIKNIVSTVLGAIGSIVSTVLSGIVSVFSSIMNGLKGVVSSVWNGIKSLFSAGVNFIKSVVHIDLSAAGRAIMNSFLNGLKSVWESVKSFVSGIAGWIKDHKGPISLDRKLLIPAGQAIMNGLNSGLINGFSEVQSNVSDMANQIQQAVTSPGFDIGSNIGNLGSVNTNYTGSLAVQDSQLQMQNNALLRQLVNKDTTMVLDDGTLVGYTAGQYDQRLGQNTALKDRWSR